MPTWVFALQLALGLLQDIAPLIENTIASVAAAGGDPTPHQAAQAALSNSINDLTQVVTAVQTKS